MPSSTDWSRPRKWAGEQRSSRWRSWVRAKPRPGKYRWWGRTAWLSGWPGVGTSNLIFQPGASSYDQILASIDEGLLLTVLMGFGTNLTTGDFSQGAAGYWIEKGKIAYPVTEINVSGNLRAMLKNIDM